MSDPRPPAAPAAEHGAPQKGSGGAAGLTPPPSAGVGADKIPRQFGRYRIIDRIGKGGMGAVFKAHDTQLDRTVAIKIPFLGTDDGEMRQRFYREARAAAALHHPNICPVYDVGEVHNLPYLTMAFIEGQSLAQVLEAGPLAPLRAALLARKVALAMQEAHSRGVIHRDLKPANVILGPKGEPVVMDFGLARRADDHRGEGLTRQGDVIGTLEYMPPEQLDGDNKAVGPAADIYALGIVLYELLTARRPFIGNTASMLTAILLKPPPRPSEVRPGVPQQLEEVCLKAMARKPEDRYATMGDLATALAEYLRAPQQAATPAPVAPPAPARPTVPEVAAETPPVRPAGRSTRPIKAQPSGGMPKPAEATVADEPAKPASGPRRPRSSANRKKKKSEKKSFLPYYIGGGVLAVACIGGVIAMTSSRPKGGETASQGDVQPPPANPAAATTPSPKATEKDAGTTKATEKKKSNPKTKPTTPDTGKKPPAPPFAVKVEPETLALAVGEEREVTVKIERGNTQGAVNVRWTAPKELRVTPAGPLNVAPGAADPVLKVRLNAEVPADGPPMEFTATPSKGAGKADPATAKLALRTTPGPCERIIELGNQPAGAVEAIAFTADGSTALVGGGPKPKPPAKGTPQPTAPGGQPMAQPKGGGKTAPAEDQYAVRVWNLAKGVPIGPLTGHLGPVYELAVSADGKTALSVSDDGTVARWNLERGVRLQAAPQSLQVITIGMSPDARRGAVVYPGMVVRVDLERFLRIGQGLKTAPLTGSDLPDAIRTAAISPKGQELIGGLDGKLFLIDPTEKEKGKPKPLVGQKEAILCSAFSPVEPLAATGGGGVMKVGVLQTGEENAVCVWDVAAAALKWKNDEHAAPVSRVVFSPDGKRLASGASDGSVRVWDVATGKPVAAFAGHTGRILGLGFTPDGTGLWSGSADRTLRQWKLP